MLRREGATKDRLIYGLLFTGLVRVCIDEERLIINIYIHVYVFVCFKESVKMSFDK